jgi:ABC-type lipoprotein release transport system permease subunit
MAWRNLWRSGRRSLVTLAAMTLALFVMISYSGLVEGYLVSMERNIVELEVGDVQVFATGYRDRPSLYDRIDDPDRILSDLDAAGYRASARLLGSGLAAGEESSSGVALHGVVVDRDAAVSAVWQRVEQGRWLDPEFPDEVVLGRRLARIIGVAPGDDLLILTQGADGSIANEIYTVRGVLANVGDATDRAGVFMVAAAFRELMVLPEGVHQIMVRRPTTTPLDRAGQEVSTVAAGYDVNTWKQLMPTLADLLDNSRGAVAVMFMIVFIAIGIVILNAMLMAVFERIREFGVLKAVGMGPLTVLRLILTETAMLSGLAVVGGIALATPALLYLRAHGIDVGAVGGMSISGIAWDPVWRAEITPQVFLGPVLMFLIIVLVAVSYPALKAARLRPVQAIRHH